jgi:hypothetical protein
MKIKIGNFVITSDPMNVILNEKYEKKDKEGEPTGEFGTRTIGFYRSLESACDALIEKEIKISDAENLAELVAYIQQVKTSIINDLKNFKKSKEKQTE